MKCGKITPIRETHPHPHKNQLNNNKNKGILLKYAINLPSKLTIYALSYIIEASNQTKH